MKPYPMTPALLDAIPEELAELYRSLEDTLLDEICSRLKLKGKLNEVTVQDIRALRSHGIDLEDIEKAIRETTGISKKKLNQLLDDVVERNQEYYTELIDEAKVTAPERLVNASDIDAIKRQTEDTFRNITASMGFLVDAGRTMLPTARAYQWALDNATMQIQSGAISYNQAIKYAVKSLADSGIKTVDYESGHVDQIDVAARRAVMTGVNQLCAKYTDQSAEYLKTDYFEVSAHAGARDKPGPSPWSSHKGWQGKVYSTKSGDKYPNIYDVCGLGAVDGLEGANCRHRRYPWVDGVSERTYTDKQLSHIDDGLGCEFEGKAYTAYEATQQQRKIERTIRKLKREKAAYKAAGLEEEEQAVNIRIRRLNDKYKAFSEEARLPEQRERMKVLYADDLPKKYASAISASTNHAIIDTNNSNENGAVHSVGEIDVEKYRMVTENIRTNEVVITDERIQHIKERHPNDYERYVQIISDMFSNPQYILGDPSPATAVILKEYPDTGEYFRMILRLVTPEDKPEYKNSIITFMKINQRTFGKYIRNKKILYRSE